MNKIGTLLRELHNAETEMANAYRAVAERQSADHGTYYPCQTLAPQCDQHAEQIRAWGERFQMTIPAPKHSAALTTMVDGMRHKSSELIGRHPVSGLLLLRDLRELYMKAEAVNINWVMLGQAARALRDHDLLTGVTALHQQTVTQSKWVKTRIKNAAPQILVVAD